MDNGTQVLSTYVFCSLYFMDNGPTKFRLTLRKKPNDPKLENCYYTQFITYRFK